MAARGQVEKEQIKQKILEVFEGAFLDDKVIRVPINDLEIKITLTAAKDVIGGGGGPKSITSETKEKPIENIEDFKVLEVDEKQRVVELLNELGFQ